MLNRGKHVTEEQNSGAIEAQSEPDRKTRDRGAAKVEAEACQTMWYKGYTSEAQTQRTDEGKHSVLNNQGSMRQVNREGEAGGLHSAEDATTPDQQRRAAVDCR